MDNCPGKGLPSSHNTNYIGFRGQHFVLTAVPQQELYIPKSMFSLPEAYLSHAWLTGNHLHQFVCFGTPNHLLCQKANCSQYRDLFAMSANSSRDLMFPNICCSNQRSNSATLLPPICNGSDLEGVDEEHFDSPFPLSQDRAIATRLICVPRGISCLARGHHRDESRTLVGHS